eukprot:Hpha_TRINITY_DN16485_c2_g2::TRINITY_DN16485_c2_g2_i1::g.160430::m.160430/K00549/metE; 5-methyltetrahydropteroyltriglutamate--homocysteine methyltransferase
MASPPDAKRFRKSAAAEWFNELGKGVPTTFDLTEAAHHRRARDIADALIQKTGGSVEDLLRLDEAWRQKSGVPPVLLLGSQLAVSKVRAKAGGERLTVVLAVFKEKNRLEAKSPTNPHGEDCLREKVLQLDWLLPERWDMIVVDDGCPENSGALFQAKAQSLEKAAQVRVVKLADFVGKQGGPPAVRQLASTEASKKGGSILLGLDLAAQGKEKGHVVAYTDADLSADLGLLGLFMQELRAGGDAAIGARFGSQPEGSCWVTAAGSHTLGDHDRKFLTMRHFFRSRLLPPLEPIIDTQCGLKVFPASVISRAVHVMRDAGNTFDMELMLRIATDPALNNPLRVVPIVWCDSVAESNFIRTNDSQFRMLKTLVRLQAEHADTLKLGAEPRAYARFLGKLTREEYDRLMDRLERYVGFELNFNVLRSGLNVGDFLHLTKPPLPTTVIGSWPKPGWLFGANPVSAKHSRGAAATLWTASGEELKQLQEKATESAVKDMCRSGLTVLADGEMRRENYVFYHLQHIDGVDFDVLTDKVYRGGTQHKELPTVTRPVRSTRWGRGYLVNDFLRTQELAGDKARVKVTLPGPMTIIDTTANSYYKTEEELAMDIAETVRTEIEALVEAGCEEVQVDEPVLVRYPEKLATWGLRALNRCFEGIHGAFFTVHICCGYATGTTEEGKDKKAPGRHYNDIAPYMSQCLAHSISLEHTYKPLDLPSIRTLLGPRKIITLGLVASCRDDVETADDIAHRLRDALKHFDREKVACCADCGMVMCSEESARAKTANLVAAAQTVRGSF